jgi:K+-sensing histidine kinase KdpD
LAIVVVYVELGFVYSNVSDPISAQAYDYFELKILYSFEIARVTCRLQEG